MEYTSLSPTSSLRISRLVFGCEPLGGADWGSVDIKEIQWAAAAALDAGVNCFDTVTIYGLGASETNLRDALGSRIKDAVICTKVGLNWQPGGSAARARVYRDSRPTTLRRTVDESLTRMGLARLPLVLVHWPDPDTPLEDTMEALMRLREKGKVGEVGLSNFAAGQIRQAHSLMELFGVQAQFSLLRRETETGILPECLSLQLGVMAWGVLAQGLLSGKYSAGFQFAANDRRTVHPNFGAAYRSRLSNLNAAVRVVADGHGVVPAQVAIRWVLDQAGISAAIVGIKTGDQLRDMLGAHSLGLTDEDRHLLGDCAENSIAAKRNANAN